MRQVVVPALVVTVALVTACGDSGVDTTPTTAPATTGPVATTTTATTTLTTVPPTTQITTTAPATTTSVTTTTSSTTTTMAITVVSIEISFLDGSVKADEARFDVPLGSLVTITITTDVEDEVHLHGYDVFQDVYEGQAEVEFEADVPGIFELEMEGSHVPLAEIQVS